MYQSESDKRRKGNYFANFRILELSMVSAYNEKITQLILES